jgi:hypothetical protein
MRAWPQRSSISGSLHFAAGHHEAPADHHADERDDRQLPKSETDRELVRLRYTAGPAHSNGDLSARLAAVTPAWG